jgi:predicted transcriptional regulator
MAQAAVSNRVSYEKNGERGTRIEEKEERKDLVVNVGDSMNTRTPLASTHCHIR